MAVDQFINPDREMTPDEVSLLMTYHKARHDLSFVLARRQPVTPKLLTEVINAAQPTVFAQHHDILDLIEWRELLVAEQEKN